ncbi:MAG: (Fe-S)-binding protein, partial [Calditrichaeota bacterium]|nr:(Fe-S)-binding protein [Calditrichota bacterium]
PCLVDQAAPDTARATVRLLERLGHEVHYDIRQTCCGQAPFNAGFRDEAATLAVRFIKLFRDAETVVAPSGSCVSMVVHHYGELELPSDINDDWQSLKSRVYELTSFLVDKLQISDVGAHFPHSVTYHASCHLLRDLGVKEQPLKLLKNVKGLQLIEGDWGDECCGYGGAFSAKYSALSHRIGDRRAIALGNGGAEYITGADDSCLMNLNQAFSRIGKPQKTIHIARILASTDGEE